MFSKIRLVGDKVAHLHLFTWSPRCCPFYCFHPNHITEKTHALIDPERKAGKPFKSRTIQFLCELHMFVWCVLVVSILKCCYMKALMFPWITHIIYTYMYTHIYMYYTFGHLSFAILLLQDETRQLSNVSWCVVPSTGALILAVERQGRGLKPGGIRISILDRLVWISLFNHAPLTRWVVWLLVLSTWLSKKALFHWSW